jgi:hypothetical protein
MTTLPLESLGAALLALRVLSAEYPDLPAPCVSVSTVYPDRLDLALHDDLSAFEAWREALGIDPGAVAYGEQSGGRTRVLSALTDYAGARIRLTGFGTVVTGGAA